MLAAARKSIEFRLSHGGGHTGWSRAWIINFWARFHEAEKAEENVVALLQKSTLPNLFDNHPPFQIDGNFGGTAGIAEMLLQSHEMESAPVNDRRRNRETIQTIELLPALPKAWSKGSVSGLRARGGFEVDMSWKDGKLERCVLHSNLGNACRIRLGDKMIDLLTRRGRAYVLDADLRSELRR
jgi:alpha-L-fucosidase 2